MVDEALRRRVRGHFEGEQRDSSVEIEEFEPTDEGKPYAVKFSRSYLGRTERWRVTFVLDVEGNIVVKDRTRLSAP